MTAAAALAAALGGAEVLKTEIESEFDLAAAAKEGIPAEAAYRVVEGGLLEPEELYGLVIPRRTIERRRDEKRPLTVSESDRLLRVVGVVIHAIDALGSADKARVWLRTPNRALRGRAPLSLVETDIGTRIVERVLGRLEHGVYS